MLANFFDPRREAEKAGDIESSVPRALEPYQWLWRLPKMLFQTPTLALLLWAPSLCRNAHSLFHLASSYCYGAIIGFGGIEEHHTAHAMEARANTVYFLLFTRDSISEATLGAPGPWGPRFIGCLLHLPAIRPQSGLVLLPRFFHCSSQ